MPIWIIEPRDPLIVRDGRPFGPNPGARARSLPFPFPSTTTGGVRHHAGVNSDGVFDKRNIPIVKRIAVRGPLLVELDSTGSVITNWLLPAPADALLLKPDPTRPPVPDTDTQQVIRTRLVPLNTPEGCVTNLPNPLLLVGQVYYRAGKPQQQVPRFWYQEQVMQWLSTPPAFEDIVPLDNLGHSGPVPETRMHVRIDRDSQMADEGMLFQTRGLEFTAVPSAKNAHSPGPFHEARRLALAVIAEQARFEPCIAALGGERRMVCWRQINEDLPACPETVIQQVCDTKACRVLLLTPACFAHGWSPTCLQTQQPGIAVTPHVQAAAIQPPRWCPAGTLKCAAPNQPVAWLRQAVSSS